MAVATTDGLKIAPVGNTLSALTKNQTKQKIVSPEKKPQKNKTKQKKTRTWNMILNGRVK